MKRPFFYLTIMFIALSFCPLSAFSKTGWVSDMLVLTFRDGPGNTHTVIKTLTSNTPVVILDEQNGFYQVEVESDNSGQTPESKEIGWVDKKFIVFKPTNAILLDQIKKEKTLLEEELKALTSDIRTQKETLSSKETENENLLTPLKNSLTAMEDENKRLKQDLTRAREKYNTLVNQSKNIQDIVKNNAALQKENKAMATELDSLKKKNRNILKTAMIKWFLAGVGVLFMGWLIGQSVSSKKRRYGSILD